MAGLAAKLLEQMGQLGSVFTSNPGNAVKTADKGSKSFQIKSTSTKPALAISNSPVKTQETDMARKFAQAVRELDDKYPDPDRHIVC